MWHVWETGEVIQVFREDTCEKEATWKIWV